MKRGRHGVWLLVLALLMTGCGGPAVGDTERVAIRVGTQPGVFVSPFLVAKDQGLFKKAGLNVEEASFLSGPAMISALIAKHIDIGYLGVSPAIIAASRDPNVVIIAVNDLSDGGEGIVVQPDEGIQAVADLRGKVIGVALGSTTHRFLIEQLRKAGLDPGHDVDIRDMSVEDQTAAFRAHKVDAVANWEPWKSKAVAAGGRELINDAQAMVRTYDVIAARKDFVTAHPRAVAAFLAADLHAAARIAADPPQAVAIVSKYVQVQPEEIAKTFRLYHFPDLSAQLSPAYLGQPERKAVTDIGFDATFLAAQGIIKVKPDLGTLFDLRPLQAAASASR